MKTSLTLILVISMVIACMTVRAESLHITRHSALEIAEKQFLEKDVDYYILEDTDSTSGTWQIFVDAEPMKGWEHDCYYVTIPKASSEATVDSVVPMITTSRVPPLGNNYSSLKVSTRHDHSVNNKPLLPLVPDIGSMTTDSTGPNIYAVIISGGISVISNWPRYWNDCSFIYQTLRNKYNIPKKNIFPLMADGADSGVDTNDNGTYISQSLDLDNDGLDDIELAATKNNVKNVLKSLLHTIKEDDHLFIYVIDHGGSTDYLTNSYICLWNNERLYDTELASYLSLFAKRNVNINVVLGQCYSGGFLDDLNLNGIVAASACTAMQQSWSCSDIPYDEFVYHWTCAVNCADHTGAAIAGADADSNDHITMREAFEYAQQHDRVRLETPQYISYPTSIGDDLAFDSSVPATDIYMRDNESDAGIQPNTYSYCWQSPDIWIRNSMDDIEEHENVRYSENPISFIYSRISNRGKSQYNGGRSLNIYWAQASSNMSREVLLGQEFNEGHPTGGFIGTVAIDSIPSESSRIVTLPWILPDFLKNYPDDNFQFCIYGYIESSDGVGNAVGNGLSFCRGYNNHAQSNIATISKTDTSKAFNFYVRNAIGATCPYSLEIIPDSSEDAAIFDIANVYLEMEPTLYSSWLKGGRLGTGIDIYSGSASYPTIAISSAINKIDNILLSSRAVGIARIRFEFEVYSPTECQYKLHIVQKDPDGNIMGGITFIVEKPTYSKQTITITPISRPESTILTTNSDDFSSITWYDASGVVISESESVEVVPSFYSNVYSVTGITEEGDCATDTITLDISSGIESISATNKILQIYFKQTVGDNAILIFASATESLVSTSVPISAGMSSITFDAQNYESGVYSISLIENGQLVDTRKITL